MRASFALQLRKMGGGGGSIAGAAVEEVTRSTPADVNASVLGQSEIEDLGAIVIEGQPHLPADGGQFLLAEWPRHCDVLMQRHNRVLEEAQSRGISIGCQYQIPCLYRAAAGCMQYVLQTFLNVGHQGVLVNPRA
jgi:hypothetical protein